MKKHEYNKDSTFPYRLRGLMEDRKVTQNKIAEVCNVTRQSVSQWQNGETRPDILALRKIAEYFNVSTDYLLGLTDVKRLGTLDEVYNEGYSLGYCAACDNMRALLKGAEDGRG